MTHDGMTEWERALLATTWVPGDPLMPDNGCGSYSEVRMTETERDQANAEGDNPPPWWRPAEEYAGPTSSRTCNDCGVKWRGPDPCWVCGEHPPPWGGFAV